MTDTIEQPRYDINQIVELVRVAADAAGVSPQIVIEESSYNGDDDKPSHLKVDDLYLYPVDVVVPSLSRRSPSLGWAVDTIVVQSNYPHAPDDAEPVTLVEPNRIAISAVRDLMLILVRRKIDAAFEPPEAPDEILPENG